LNLKLTIYNGGHKALCGMSATAELLAVMSWGNLLLFRKTVICNFGCFKLNTMQLTFFQGSVAAVPR